MSDIFKQAVRQVFHAIRLDTPLVNLTEFDLGLLDALESPFRDTLLSLYAGEPQRGCDDRLHEIDRITRIPPRQGVWLYEFFLSRKPAATLEIGMAYGYSTLFFLAAAAKRGQGRHTAIDPFQRSVWHGIGLVHAMNYAPNWLGQESFRFIEDRSDRTAADFARTGQEFDLIFIDGNHRFDDVLVDFYLFSQVCRVGGHIVLDDARMSSVKTAANFIRSNRRDFSELPSRIGNIAIFQKTGEDQRNWNEFVKFRVARSS